MGPGRNLEERLGLRGKFVEPVASPLGGEELAGLYFSVADNFLRIVAVDRVDSRDRLGELARIV